MQPSTARHFSASKIFSLCVLICLSALPVLASQGSIVIRDNVSHKKQNELVHHLRSITGWTTLDFDREGYLQLGREGIAKGSSLARQLLYDAVRGSKLIVIEDASSSADIAFCRVVPALVKTPSDTSAFVILIDFSDFHQITGDRAALASFNVGWGVLHELEHVVADSEDPDSQETLGTCEVHINKMRDELSLPQRTNYFFTDSNFKPDPNFQSQFVRMGFQSQDSQTNKLRKYWLVWDFRSVGGLITNSQTAVARRTSSK